MTGRRAYEMFTRAFGGMNDWQRKETQFGNGNADETPALIAWDDLHWAEQGAWKNIARQVDRLVARSKAASKAS